MQSMRSQRVGHDLVTEQQDVWVEGWEGQPRLPELRVPQLPQPCWPVSHAAAVLAAPQLGLGVG